MGFEQATKIEVMYLAGLGESKFIQATITKLLTNIEGLSIIA